MSVDDDGGGGKRWWYELLGKCERTENKKEDGYNEEERTDENWI